MTPQAQIEANRRNAQKSTGPKTPEGKARVSLNALKHGIRARSILDQLQRTPLWDEEPQEFADLVQSLADQFQPEGLYEEMCLEDVALCQWRLRRVARAETGHIAAAQRIQLDGPGRDNPRLHARNALPDLAVLDKLNRYETSLRRQLDRSLATLDKHQTRRHEMATTAPARDAAPTRSILDSPSRTNYYERVACFAQSPPAPRLYRPRMTALQNPQNCRTKPIRLLDRRQAQPAPGLSAPNPCPTGSTRSLQPREPSLRPRQPKQQFARTKPTALVCRERAAEHPAP